MQIVTKNNLQNFTERLLANDKVVKDQITETVKGIEYVKTAGVSNDTVHSTNGMNILTDWFINGQYNKEDLILSNGICQFNFDKNTETAPSGWWMTILTSKLGTVNTLKGKKLFITIKQEIYNSIFIRFRHSSKILINLIKTFFKYFNIKAPDIFYRSNKRSHKGTRINSRRI